MFKLNPENWKNPTQDTLNGGPSLELSPAAQQRLSEWGSELLNNLKAKWVSFESPDSRRNAVRHLRSERPADHPAD